MRRSGLAAAVAYVVGGRALAFVAGTPASAPPLAVATALGTANEVASMSPQDTESPTGVPSQAIPDGYRIQLPRLGIDLPFEEGDIKRDIEDQRTPENYAFHLPGTALPGHHGNTYLYAHARRGMFLSLWNAQPGDQVFVSAPDGRVLAYFVRAVLPRVAPADVSSAQPTTAERLTLQTSSGPNRSDPRFVVIALPVVALPHGW
jgi:sortase (surface protein transpeptidase)